MALQSRTEPSAIVNISSGLAFFPKQTTSLYCAAKAGLHSLSQSVRYQCEGSKTQISEAILPLVATPMTERRGTGKMEPDRVARAILAGVKAGRSEILVGKAWLLPVLQRLAPSLGRSLLRGR